MKWPSVEAFEASLSLPPGVRVRRCAHEDVPRVIESLKNWYPNLTGAEDATLLTRSFYETEVALDGDADESDARPGYALLFEHDAAPVGFFVMDHELDDNGLLGRMSVIDPAWRGRGLGRAFIRAQVAVARAMGVRSTYGFVELDNHAQCKALEREGFVLSSLLPDSDRKRVPGVGTRYVPEALYIHSLVAPEDLLWPPAEALQPRTAALLDYLFGSGDPAVLPPYVPTHAPEIAPSVAAVLDARPGGRATWPDAHAFTPQLEMPPGFSVHQLGRADVPALIAQLPAWHPEVFDGSKRYILDPAFYEESVAFAGETTRIDERPAYVWCVREGGASGPIVAVGTIGVDVERSTLRTEHAIIAPSHRGLRLSGLITLYVLIARAIEIETVVGWASMRHPYAQKACEKHGFRLIGIVPASERISVAPGVTKYTFEAAYAISLVPPSLAWCPPRSAMLPRVAALARFVLGDNPA